jgi:type IV pilus assembly protein PilE
MHKANNRGYSLLEVMIVLLIMSILAMAAVPLYQRHLVKSRRYEAEQVLIASALALEHYHQTARSYKAQP